MKIINIVFICLVSCFGLFTPSGYAGEADPEFVINIGRQQGSFAAFVYERVYSRLMPRLGFIPVFKYLPAKRSLHEANLGITDADAGRIEGVEKEDVGSNLIRIDEPVYIDHLSLFAVKPLQINGSGWEIFVELYRREEIVPIAVQGIVAVKVHMPEEVYRHACLVRNIDLALHNLRKPNGNRRRDILVHAESETMDAIKRLNISDVKKIKRLNLHVLYPVIHKRWQHISKAMEAELKKMKANGEYQEILLQVENEFFVQ
ncbi:hypothetical protein [Psychromonas aquimarina]|uniref:hypothetical protein n=1 Tax=Psychromonas aquimarina TaxID=444919 RepID=UPI00048A7437|nr:hypothetical protein [Psychromonas aquimarina]